MVIKFELAANLITVETLLTGRYNNMVRLITYAGFARNPTRLGEARFPSPHEREALAPRYS
ncbi:MAG: hypothetical protein FWH55_05875, partial [Oscillospiraceae bacterium]|nr:hypothetical protein [Oscillospiraceae bacterium]